MDPRHPTSGDPSSATLEFPGVEGEALIKVHNCSPLHTLMAHRSFCGTPKAVTSRFWDAKLRRVPSWSSIVRVGLEDAQMLAVQKA